MTKTLADTIIYGTADDVERAIERGADLFEIDEYGFNAMVQAAIMKKTDVAAVLLNHGCYIDLPDLAGRTALHWAVDNNDIPLCKLLLEKGADPNAYSFTAQPVLTYPYLRGQYELKTLLYQYNASLNFVQDFVNAKLLGHRFELASQTHIVNAKGDFILVDFEGFMFEFTNSLIQDSLHRFEKNYAAKHLLEYFEKVDEIVDALNAASELLKYQQISIELDKDKERIDQLLNRDMLLIPIVYTGHAVTGVKFRNIFVKCDRGEYGRKHATITVYRINKPKRFNNDLIKQILYKSNSAHFIHYELNDIVELEPIYTLPIDPQVSGNCSWANVEAAVPAMMFLLFLADFGTVDRKNMDQAKNLSIDFFQRWHEWDQDRAIDECVQSFYAAGPKRKATKAQILSSIFVHRCHYENEKDVKRAEKMIPVLTTPGYEYLLQAYIKEYTRDKKSRIGKNLNNLLDLIKYNA